MFAFLIVIRPFVSDSFHNVVQVRMVDCWYIYVIQRESTEQSNYIAVRISVIVIMIYLTEDPLVGVPRPVVQPLPSVSEFLLR